MQVSILAGMELFHCSAAEKKDYMVCFLDLLTLGT